jgi:hypothetical protein
MQSVQNPLKKEISLLRLGWDGYLIMEVVVVVVILHNLIILSPLPH